MTEKKLVDLLVDEFEGGRRKVTVLGVNVYVTPLTLHESNQLVAKFPNDATRRNVETLIVKCQDAAGNPIFTADDRPKLARKVKGSSLGVLFAAINGESGAVQEEK